MHCSAGNDCSRRFLRQPCEELPDAPRIEHSEHSRNDADVGDHDQSKTPLRRLKAYHMKHFSREQHEYRRKPAYRKKVRHPPASENSKHKSQYPNLERERLQKPVKHLYANCIQLIRSAEPAECAKRNGSCSITREGNQCLRSKGWTNHGEEAQRRERNTEKKEPKCHAAYYTTIRRPRVI